jgi:hypothetical protein
VKTRFQDIITGGESWMLIDAAPSSVWLSLDEELSTRPRRAISPDKRMLVVIWEIKSIVHVNWLPKDGRINAFYFGDEILTAISQKLEGNASRGHRSWTQVHMDNA